MLMESFNFSNNLKFGQQSKEMDFDIDDALSQIQLEKEIKYKSWERLNSLKQKKQGILEDVSGVFDEVKRIVYETADQYSSVKLRQHLDDSMVIYEKAFMNEFLVDDKQRYANELKVKNMLLPQLLAKYEDDIFNDFNRQTKNNIRRILSFGIKRRSKRFGGFYFYMLKLILKSHFVGKKVIWIMYSSTDMQDS